VLGIGILQIILGLLTLQPSAQGPSRPAPQPVTRNPHGAINIPCENCHTSTGWKPIRGVPEFNHEKTRYPLRGMHEKVQCTQCHTKLVFTNVGSKCADCHADIHRRQFGANCEQCHTVSGWNVSVQAIQNHFNRFPLLGAHAALDCAACHKGAATGQFQGLPTQCYACHAKQFQQTTNPSHVTASFPTACEQCHGMNTWLDAKFNHLQLSGFALTGAHAQLPCSACHVGGQFTGTPATCVGCHLKDFQGTTNPSHVQAAFPQTCQTCHNTSAWQPATFNHNTFTTFPLTGAHVSVACTLCHINGVYATAPTTCVGCHLKDFQGTTNPNHAQAGIPQTCELCHMTTAWQPATFDHSKTVFPLTGAHTSVACSACHTNGVFPNTPTTCVACHLNQYQATTSPNHTQAGLPTDCKLCHTTTAWTGAVFNHSATGFPLTGFHTSVACASCHVNNNYSLTVTTCISCHLAIYQATTTPNHIQAGFPQTCETCHTTTAWTGATFNHSTTGFPLTGFHTTVACASCHVNGNYSLTTTTCVSCHLKDFQGTTNPIHAQAGFPQTCETCHTTTAWQPANFNHNTFTTFPLTGAHVTVACTLCHVNSVYAGAPTTCVGCHLANFQGTTNPNHTQAGFPTDCTVCHTTTAWTGAVFNHSTTGFPLTGFHATVACASCHINNNYSLTVTTCVSCHLKNYQATTSPNHAQVGFPQQCELCHTTTVWQPSTFNHNTTAFPLTGFHTTVACASCHVNNNFTTLPTDCYGCHKADYTATTNPNHAAAGFPTTCATCHTTTSWLGATFNHTWFSLNHGGANGVCATCHTNSSDYTVFVCTSCHTKAQTDPKHSGVNGYVWNSANCYQCHKN
jgi:NMD protein affecting ribosome stability and mRNA decay